MRKLHDAGKIVQYFVCYMNLLSEIYMQDAWNFHLLQKVCQLAWLQHVSFICKVNKERLNYKIKAEKADAQKNVLILSWVYFFANRDANCKKITRTSRMNQTDLNIEFVGLCIVLKSFSEEFFFNFFKFRHSLDTLHCLYGILKLSFPSNLEE